MRARKTDYMFITHKIRLVRKLIHNLSIRNLTSRRAPTFTGSAGTVNVSGNQSDILAGTPIVGGVPVGQSAPGDAVENGNLITPTASGTFTPQGAVQSLNGGVAQTAMKIMPSSIVVPYLIWII